MPDLETHDLDKRRPGEALYQTTLSGEISAPDGGWFGTETRGETKALPLPHVTATDPALMQRILTCLEQL